MLFAYENNYQTQFNKYRYWNSWSNSLSIFHSTKNAKIFTIEIWMQFLIFLMILYKIQAIVKILICRCFASKCHGVWTNIHWRFSRNKNSVSSCLPRYQSELSSFCWVYSIWIHQKHCHWLWWKLYLWSGIKGKDFILLNKI